jgi:hypothetical protein
MGRWVRGAGMAGAGARGLAAASPALHGPAARQTNDVRAFPGLTLTSEWPPGAC